MSKALTEELFQEIVLEQASEQYVSGRRKIIINDEIAKNEPSLEELRRALAQDVSFEEQIARAINRINIDSGPIHFDDGVPMRGWLNATLFRDGSWNFAGHFHNSGFVAYNVNVVVGVRLGGSVFTFPKQGRAGGTIGGGSRNFDWNDQGTNPALGNAMAGARDYEWTWYAAAGLSIGELTDLVKETIGIGASIIALL